MYSPLHVTDSPHCLLTGVIAPMLLLPFSNPPHVIVQYLLIISFVFVIVIVIVIVLSENILTYFPYSFLLHCKFLIWCWLHFTQDGLAIYFVVFGGSVEHPWDILNFRRAPIGKTNSAMFFLVLTENAVVMLNFWQLSISFQTTADMHSFSKQNKKLPSIVLHWIHGLEY